MSAGDRQTQGFSHVFVCFRRTLHGFSGYYFEINNQSALFSDNFIVIYNNAGASGLYQNNFLILRQLFLAALYIGRK